MRNEFHVGKGKEIFDVSATGNGKVYRGIMKLICQFGYISHREVMYGFGLNRFDARERLRYLLRIGLIQAFASHSLPPRFFCLSRLGRAVVREKHLSDHASAFQPSDYNPTTQIHNRTLMMIFLALEKILGNELLSWTSEWTLKKGIERTPRDRQDFDKRQFDGEFEMLAKETMFVEATKGNLTEVGVEQRPWRCGVEYEHSLKSAHRYRAQFKHLAGRVYDSLDKTQSIPAILFLCGSPHIKRRLIDHSAEGMNDYGRCVFLFGEANLLIDKLGSAPLTKVIPSISSATKCREITAAEMNLMRTKVKR